MKPATKNDFFARTSMLAIAAIILGLVQGCGGGGGGSTPQSQGVLMGGAVQGVTLNLTGAVTTLAGSGSVGNADGTGTAALFAGPYDVTTDGSYLYVADTLNSTVRRVVIATGETTTLAGSGSVGTADSTDGTGATAMFMYPAGITSDGTNLYVADANNHTIRQVVIATGETTTLAGSGSAGFADGTGAAAMFNNPAGVTTDGTHLYVGDSNNNTIRQIVIATGETTTLAGSVTGAAGNSDSTDGTGATALFSWPSGVTTDGTNLYVADTSNHSIRQVVIATGETTTLAGAGAFGNADSTDGTGATATFDAPYGITCDDTYLYVGDSNNNTIRQIVIATGKTTTLAGSVTGAAGNSDSTDGTGATALFSWPSGVTTDGTNLYVADTDNNAIRRIQ